MDFGSLDGSNWRDEEARANLAAIEAAKRKPMPSWHDIFGAPGRMLGALASTPVQDADAGAMMPETYVNPLVKGAMGAVGEAVKSGVTAPGDALAGKIPAYDPEGHVSPEMVGRGFDTAALAGGGSVASTLGRNIPEKLVEQARARGSTQFEKEFPRAEPSSPPETNVGGGAGGRDQGVAEATTAATRRAGAHQPLEGLPTGALKIGDELFVPGPIGSIRDVAGNYMLSRDPADHSHAFPTRYHDLDKNRSTAIARAFDEMKHEPDNPRVKASYDAMVKETGDQFDHLMRSGLKIEPIPPNMPDPYAANPRLAAKDVGDNNHLWFFPTEQGFGTGAQGGIDLSAHPMMQQSGRSLNGQPLLNNDLFRVVHDYFGHLKEGYGFRAAGEDNAWRSHAGMYSDLARPAMTTETRGQNSWVNYGPHGESNRTASAADTKYADQKVGLLPDWVMSEDYPGKAGTTLREDAAPGLAVSAGEHAPAFNLSAEEALKNTARKSGTGAQWMNELKRYGAKPEELDWRGASDLFQKNANAPMTRAQVEQHFAGNPFEVKPVDMQQMPENWKGLTPDQQHAVMDKYEQITGNPADTMSPDWYDEIADHSLKGHETALDSIFKPPQYTQYQLPGGENYRERLLTMPEKNPFSGDIVRKYHGFSADEWNGMKASQQKELKLQMARAEGIDPSKDVLPFKGSHWDEPNVLVHRRTTDRTFTEPLTAEQKAAVDARKQAQVQINDVRQQINAVARQMMGQSKTLENARAKRIMDDMAAGRISRPEGMRALDSFEKHPELKPLQDNLQALRAREDAIRQGLPPEPKPASSRSVHAEEIQSDWHQAGQNKGYLRPDDGFRPGAVPDAPFKDSWHRLALNDMIREAAEKGADEISWTAGRSQPTNPKNLNPNVPQDVAAKAEAGLTKHYDEKLVNAANKIGKPHGVSVEPATIPRDLDAVSGGQILRARGIDPEEWRGYTQEQRNKLMEEWRTEGHAIFRMKVPQSLKDQALKKGFSLFEDTAPVSTAAQLVAGSRSAPDKQPGPKIISVPTPRHRATSFGSLDGRDDGDHEYR